MARKPRDFDAELDAGNAKLTGSARSWDRGGCDDDTLRGFPFPAQVTVF